MSARRLYVYYRVARADEAAVMAAIRAMQRTWQAVHAGLHCELLRRDDGAAADEVTLMEVYGADDGVSAAWQARIESDATALLAPWRCSARHVEVFVPCPSP